MRSYRSIVQFCIAVLFLLGASSAFAQATRTWVSGVGDDANPCSRTAPCKTFAGAISKTATGGTIDVLDPGGFGAVTITKPITLEAIGTVAGVLVSGTNGIVINSTASATDTIVLRGLAIDGLGTGLAGVKVFAAGKVVIERCTIQNFTAHGVDFEPSTANAQLVISDSTINNNVTGGTTSSGVFVQATGATASLTHVRLAQNNFGLQVRTGTASVQDSTLSGNTVANLKSYGIGTSKVNLNNTLVSDGAGVGILAQGGTATVWMSNSTVTGNATGLSTISGVINSYGNNRIFGNTSFDGTPTNTLSQM
jgi:hypothetical protein